MEKKTEIISVVKLKQDQERHVNLGTRKHLILTVTQVKAKARSVTIIVETRTKSKIRSGAIQQIHKHHGRDAIQLKLHPSILSMTSQTISERGIPEEERETDADYETLYHNSKRILKKRSLIFLFTNFESKYALDRAMPVLRNLSKAHLLVPIVFKNNELENEK